MKRLLPITSITSVALSLHCLTSAQAKKPTEPRGGDGASYRIRRDFRSLDGTVALLLKAILKVPIAVRFGVESTAAKRRSTRFVLEMMG